MAVTKVINSESKQYKPVLTDTMVLDAVPTVNSLNGVTSDAVARAIAGASGEVPQVTENDNGKVLKAIYDAGGPAVEWGEATVDQNYDATSTNAQSGVAVAQAIAAIPSDVTTASGYFRLGGSNPVKVQYTGSAEQIVTPANLDVDDHTKYYNEGTASSNVIFVWFDNTDGLKDLGDSYTATLKMKAASLLAGFPTGVTVYNTSPLTYCTDSNWSSISGPNMTGTLTITNNDIQEQTITVSGRNLAGATSGYGAYLGFNIVIVNTTNPDTGTNYNLTDALDALITNIEAGNVFELTWPCVSAGTDMVTTIPNIPAMTNQNDKFLKTVQTGASTWEMQWDTVNQVPISSSYNAGQVLTVNSSGTPRWEAPATVTVDQTYNASSTNAQSGTAVAGALASLPTPIFYNAGDGIDVTNDEISVKYGSTLTVGSATVSSSFTAPTETLDTTSTSYSYSYAYGCGTPVTSDIVALANNGGSATIAFTASTGAANTFTISPSAPHVGIFFLYSKTDTTKCIVIKSSETNVVNMFGAYYYVNILANTTNIELDFSDVVCYGGASLSDVSVGDWYIGFGAKGTNYECPTTTAGYWGGLFANSTSTLPANTLTGSYPGPIDVANPLPASTSADENKVLTVNSSGNAVWSTPSASYTAGDGIEITANEVSVKAGRNLGFEANAITVTLQAPSSQVGASDYGYALLGKLDADTVALLKSGSISLTPKYNYTISMTGIVNSGARFVICQASGYGQPLGNGKWLISEDVLSTSGDTSFTLTADTAYNVDFSTLSSKSTGTWTDVEANPTNFYLALAAYSTQYSIADVQSFGKTGAITNPPNPGDVSSYTIGDPSDISLYAVDQIPAYSSLDAGKVLQVQNDGSLAWVTLS